MYLLAFEPLDTSFVPESALHIRFFIVEKGSLDYKNILHIKKKLHWKVPNGSSMAPLQNPHS